MSVSHILEKHYEETFSKYGATSMGVDWGTKEENLRLRYKRMLEVVALDDDPPKCPTLLDVGCGFGGLLEYAENQGISLLYSGIDIVSDMIKYAKRNLSEGEFSTGDFLSAEYTKVYDYIVCNGIFTQKLTATVAQMDKYVEMVVEKMFTLARRGIAFNLMTSHVNFYAENLFYKNPVEMMSIVLNRLSKHVVINHLYPPMHEYTMYVYKDGAV